MINNSTLCEKVCRSKIKAFAARPANWPWPLVFRDQAQ